MFGRRIRVVLLAAAVRIANVGLTLLFDYVFDDYDTSTSLLPRKECDITLREEDASVLSSLAVWDTVFFVRIAQCGYEYEQYHAFFPLLPSQLHHRRSTEKSYVAIPEIMQWIAALFACPISLIDTSPEVAV